MFYELSFGDVEMTEECVESFCRQALDFVAVPVDPVRELVVVLVLVLSGREQLLRPAGVARVHDEVQRFPGDDQRHRSQPRGVAHAPTRRAVAVGHHDHEDRYLRTHGVGRPRHGAEWSRMERAARRVACRSRTSIGLKNS